MRGKKEAVRPLQPRRWEAGGGGKQVEGAGGGKGQTGDDSGDGTARISWDSMGGVRAGETRG